MNHRVSLLWSEQPDQQKWTRDRSQEYHSQSTGGQKDSQVKQKEWTSQPKQKFCCSSSWLSCRRRNDSLLEWSLREREVSVCILGVFIVRSRWLPHWLDCQEGKGKAIDASLSRLSMLPILVIRSQKCWKGLGLEMQLLYWFSIERLSFCHDRETLSLSWLTSSSQHNQQKPPTKTPCHLLLLQMDHHWKRDDRRRRPKREEDVLRMKVGWKEPSSLRERERERVHTRNACEMRMLGWTMKRKKRHPKKVRLLFEGSVRRKCTHREWKAKSSFGRRRASSAKRPDSLLSLWVYDVTEFPFDG